MLQKKKITDLQKGDIFKEEIKDAVGSEQKGFRPLMVISEQSFNRLNGYVLVCPLSKQEYNEPDGIKVKTEHGNIIGYVLTQHLFPFYWEDDSSIVKVNDTVTSDTMEKCIEVFKAIIAVTDYRYSGFNQGDIVEVDYQNSRIYAVVLSENSFNQLHNSVWVAPILIENEWDEQMDHILLKNHVLFKNSYGLAYVNEIRNVNIKFRNVAKTGYKVSTNELEQCIDVLNTFLNE